MKPTRSQPKHPSLDYVNRIESTQELQRLQPRSVAQPNNAWRTVVWDDPINLMVYVTRVFREHFGYSQQHAESLMRQVHENGKATVSVGMRERMEADVMAMHSYGLHATLERNGD